MLRNFNIATLWLMLCFPVLAISQTNEFTIVAVGDIMLANRLEPYIRDFGYSYPFLATSSITKAADISIGNLECPMADVGAGMQNKKFIFCADPRTVESLIFAGFDIMSLANNHILDFGKSAFYQTMDILNEKNILYCGAGKNKKEACELKIIKVKGIKVGFLAFSLTYPSVYWATETKYGTATVDAEELPEIVKSARKQADFLVISFHWGSEYKSYIKSYQKILAHKAIINGANLILGHHPHVIQGIEIYKKGLIVYSLGNFAFGSYGKPPERKSDKSLILKIIVKNKKIKKAELIPLNVFNYEVKFQPQVAKGKKAQEILEHIKKISAPFKTKISIENDTGVINFD